MPCAIALLSFAGPEVTPSRRSAAASCVLPAPASMAPKPSKRGAFFTAMNAAHPRRQRVCCSDDENDSDFEQSKSESDVEPEASDMDPELARKRRRAREKKARQRQRNAAPQPAAAQLAAPQPATQRSIGAFFARPPAPAAAAPPEPANDAADGAADEPAGPAAAVPIPTADDSATDQLTTPPLIKLGRPKGSTRDRSLTRAESSASHRGASGLRPRSR
jgi:hypothetical protein